MDKFNYAKLKNYRSCAEFQAKQALTALINADSFIKNAEKFADSAVEASLNIEKQVELIKNAFQIYPCEITESLEFSYNIQKDSKLAIEETSNIVIRLRQ